MMTWLEKLKPGDKVIVTRNHRQDTVETVKSIGKKLISLENLDVRFRLIGGSSAGKEVFYSYQLRPATEEALKKLEQQKLKLELVEKLEKVNFSKLPLEVLTQISKLVEGENNA